ncbi:citrate transporter [Hyphomonas sp.]|jgi:Na+/H+ antiporter NhaD/arsenite permease-like protein|uniref:citrate transporter n=1 Tax=Hyphomonas sp. TaxID=87 RepID=UPI0037C016A7
METVMTTLAAMPGQLMAVPVEFYIFGLTLLGVALFHHRTLTVALCGLATTVVYKLIFSGFADGAGFAGLAAHADHEAVILSNLMLLLLGFALLANQFERSNIPEAMPRVLPDGWLGGLTLLALVFVLSAFLDNIAAAIIGGVVARHVYHGKVSIGFLASIVAAANAGGAGSVIGDTTTTMMWISGVSPFDVLKAFIASVVAFAIFGVLGALQQHRFYPIQAHKAADSPKIDTTRAVIVGLILATLLAVNFAGNAWYPEHQDAAPWLGLGLWAAVLITAIVRAPQWSVLPEAAKGALFLVSLVATASLMPVESLPVASWQTAFGLGFLSSIFDNIPLTALALKQGGYDWGILAFAVGFGGSMMWFGSSAGVALSGLFPQARSVASWLRHGWYVPIAYVAGFAAMLALAGWHPTTTRAERPPQSQGEAAPPKVVDDALRAVGETWRNLTERIGQEGLR